MNDYGEVPSQQYFSHDIVGRTCLQQEAMKGFCHEESIHNQNTKAGQKQKGKLTSFMLIF